jgi:hypothetical protein
VVGAGVVGLPSEEVTDDGSDHRHLGDWTPYAKGGTLPQRVDSFLADGLTEEDVDRWTPPACLLRSNGTAGWWGPPRRRSREPRPAGRNGLYGWQGQLRDRLTRPLVRGERGDLVETGWDTAMGRVVDRPKRLLEEKGAAVARLLHLRSARAGGVLRAHRLVGPQPSADESALQGSALGLVQDKGTQAPGPTGRDERPPSTRVRRETR